MNLVYIILIFVVISFIYLHIVGQYKRSQDLEIYEMDYTNIQSLQNTCAALQPLIFEWRGDVRSPITFMENSKFVMHIKDTNDFYRGQDDDSPSPESISLITSSTVKLMRKDANSHYFSENNKFFIEDSGFLKSKDYMELEKALRPLSVAAQESDILLGSKGTCLPLRYHTRTRKFIYVATGSIRVKMTTWKHTPWLNEKKDYENYDFRSTHNIWQLDSELEDTLQFLEFDVVAGYVLYIPPFWWYSLKYMEIDTVLIQYDYNSSINCIAFLGDNIRYLLQQQNITTKFTKQVVPKSDDPEILHNLSEPDTEPMLEHGSEPLMVPETQAVGHDIPRNEFMSNPVSTMTSDSYSSFSGIDS